ncbi:hypothetical protein [Myroides guanonis]|uniref:Uncharacterized protein n=1 Tax=Myroides guanonis TaxID=1150112 RepID=A0A1I3S000_9FLAO|nr:hypothetical protein [Myroides guanonis]SFJ52173.1 hypothetical protein SAMN04487893_10977 [Myroides guanonis]
MRIVRNILAVLLGLVIGSMVNMGIIMISGSIIPPPEGVDMTTTEGLQAGMHMLEPKHYIFPFLAHALGTFVGALVAYMMAAQYKKSLAIGIGVFFLLGGVASVLMLPSPIWYTVVDLLGAYIPFAYLAVWIAQKK